MATHSSILAWRILMDRGAWRTAVHGSQRIGHNRATKHTTCVCVYVYIFMCVCMYVCVCVYIYETSASSPLETT